MLVFFLGLFSTGNAQSVTAEPNGTNEIPNFIKLKLGATYYFELTDNGNSSLIIKMVDTIQNSDLTVTAEYVLHPKYGTILTVTNPFFPKTLMYRAFIPTGKGFIETSIIPVRKISKEMWHETISEMLLTEFEFIKK